MSPATHDPVLTFAQVELGGLRFGLATEHVVQALPRPPSLTRLPRSHGALEGVFNNRGQVVPVVDLRKWMADAPAADSTPPHVMVLGAEGRVVGVAVDAIRGLLRVHASRVHRVHRDDSNDSFFHSVAMPDDGSEPVSLLDPVRLMAQTQAWASGNAIGETTAAAAQHNTGGTTTATPRQALLRLGTTLLAVPALHVGEVLPALPVQRIFGRDNLLAGMVRWRQHDLPLVNPHRTLGLPATPPPAPSRLVAVLRWGDRGLALPVDEVMGLHSFAQASVQAAADSGLEHASLFAGTSFYTQQNFIGYSDISWMAVAGLILLPTLLGHLSLTYLVNFMNLSVMTCGKLIEPVLASIIAYFIFHESLLPEAWIAFFLTSISVVILFAPDLLKTSHQKA